MISLTMLGSGFHWEFNVTHREDPVLHHPSIQFQRFHKQLGPIEAIYPHATHTRFDHAGYTMLIAHHICDVLEKRKRLPDSRQDIINASKLHDFGHPPFSHAVEYVLRSFTKMNHKQRALSLLDSDKQDSQGRTLKDVLEYANCDVKNIRRMLAGENPAMQICSAKTIGADKLAYAFMDSAKVGFNTMPPQWMRMVKYLSFYNDKLVVDISHDDRQLDHPISMICANQDFEFRLYTEVYWSPLSLAYQRHIERAVELAIRANVLDPSGVWELPDSTLLDRINNGTDKKTTMHKEAVLVLQGFMDRDPYTSALAFKYEPYTIDRLSQERVVTVKKDFAHKFMEVFTDPQKRTKLEDGMYEKLGYRVLVPIHPDPNKVKPVNIDLYVGGKFQGTLKDFRERHYQNLEELADSFFAIRVLVHHDELSQVLRNKNVSKLEAVFYEEAERIIEETYSLSK